MRSDTRNSENITTNRSLFVGYSMWFILFCHLLPISINAQRLDHVQGEVLVQLKPFTKIRSLVNAHSYFRGEATNFQYNKLVSKPMNIVSFTFDFTEINEYHFLESLRKDKAIELAQFNHFIQLRSTIPNDPLFDQQWQYINTGFDGGTPDADLDIDLAWDVATGGVTATGDTIVVCIIDDGIDLNHEDLSANIWFNRFEIPNNGIDDDNNGFLDDYQGWNTGTSDDNVGIDGSHGTPVTGIIGAIGNNNIGVAGVNWNVQLMIVHGGTGVESEALEAYSYPLTQRIRYNQTNGEEGAFVVATNASWGVDDLFPEDAPLWCAYYDTLGVHGILNCGATTNDDTNVDTDGDLPTTCPSDYLIAVTNVDRTGQRVEDSGYGTVSIDLGAFGEETFTIAVGNNYDAFSGTSAATPHVAGAIALLYSVPCPAFMNLVEENPADAALLIREAILAGVDTDPSLSGTTASGGRLNINNSLELFLQNCADCTEPLNIEVNDLTDTEATLSWVINDSITRLDLRWRAVDASDWNVVSEVSSPYILNELSACTGYEFQLKTFCNLDTLDYSERIDFKTDGCCVPPAILNFSEIEPSAAQVSWGPILAAESYMIRIRAGELADWMVFSTETPSYSFDNLMACTNYEVQVQTICSNTTTDFGPSQFLLTLGCGSCTEATYCIPAGNNSSEEWIERVQLATLEHSSGSDNGYGDHTNLTAPILMRGASYTIEVEPGFAAQGFNEYFLVWIDYDQDGSFGGDEIVFDPGSASIGSTTGTITIPGNAMPGNTRMRVVMQFNTPGEACNLTGLELGEMEDYCVEIVPGEGDCIAPSNLTTTSIEENSAMLEWETVGPAESYLLRFKPISSDIWTVLTASTNSFLLQGLQICETYEAQVRSACGTDGSAYSPSLVFATSCVTSTAPAPASVALSIYPNPFQETFQLDIELYKASSMIQVQLFSVQGQKVYESGFSLNTLGRQNVEIAPGLLPAGVYLLRLMLEDGTSITKKVFKKG